MRCMLYVKRQYSREQYEAAFQQLYTFLWEKHQDVSKPEVLAECLAQHFESEEVKTIISKGTDPQYKKLLQDDVAALVAKGAFGAPWMIVTNVEGKQEPFFGSDRSVTSAAISLDEDPQLTRLFNSSFHFVLQFLGIPFRDIEILPASEAGGSKL